MKIRNAAALALVGWYLMVPPYTKSVGGGAPKGVETDAPLSDWKNLKRFNSVDKCEAQRQKWKSRATRDNPIPTFWVPYVMAACIAADDPRLKAK